jgi:hypothetical protein
MVNYFLHNKKEDAMEYDQDRAKALVHHIAHSVPSDCLGSVKLNKVLWYADFVSYLRLGEPITGETYVKRQYGPAPKHIQFIIEELKRAGALVVKEGEFYGYSKKEFVSTKKPDISVFSPNEISIVDEAIRFVCYGNTANSISEKTHGIVWELADMGEEMPYETAFLEWIGEINEDDIAWAQGTR